MTSLEKQLKSLRTAVSAQLGVERVHVSLLFDKKEAHTLYVEDALKIGRAGLAELRTIDPEIAVDAEDLFDDAAMNIQRVLLTKEENEELNKKLERVIVQLSAYLHHLAAKQVLEWLIFRFQVQSFNAETLFIAFLSYHNTNIFGRLLSILDLKGLEYDWTKEYAKLEAPIPLEKLVVICTSRNHSLLTLIHNYIERVRELFDAEYLETKLPHLFTFYASLCVHILAESNVTDGLIAKVIPFLGRGLVSDIVSLRLSCLIVASQLCTKATLVPEKLQPMISLILLKMDSFTMKESLDTLVVICQREEITSFQIKSKTALKLAKKDANLHISRYIKTLFSITDMHPFICAFAHTFIPMLAKFDDEEKVTELCNFCNNCLDLSILDDGLSEMILNLVFGLLSETNDIAKIPDPFYKHMRALILRFPNTFATVRAEWQVRDENVFNMLVKGCKLEQHEIESFEVPSVEKRKRRRRRSSLKNSTGDESEPSSSTHLTKPAVKKKRPEEVKNEQLSAIHEPLKVVFKGDPLEKLIDTIKAENWSLAEAGLEKLSSPSYVKNLAASDFEDFIAKMIAVALAEGARLKTAIKNALSQLPMEAGFALSLLKPYTELKTPRRNRGTCHWVCFKEEDSTKFESRRQFVLELLIATDNLQASAKLFQQLYEILKEAMKKKVDESNHALQQLIINFIVRLIKNPRGYKVMADDLQLDTVVDIVRHTQDHRILRGCLQLLTCAVTVSPKKVLAHLMSVYTFMGDGILKKDNDLTLSVIEETLNVLFSTVMDAKAFQDPLFHERLITTSRLFATSITDIPAHRRDRILRAVARAATSDYLWAVIAVLYERYCLNWLKKAEGRISAELYEEMSTTMASEYDAVEQLSCAANVIEHIITLGGDFASSETPAASDSQQEKFVTKIFDRSKHSVQKLRHYRFAVLGWITRLLDSDEFQSKLSAVDDHSYGRLLKTAKYLLFCSVELDDFVTTETSDAEKRSAQQQGGGGDSGQQYNLKYWNAVSSRANIIIEKFQNLLPSNICGQLVADVLGQTESMPKLRDRALQFLNAKLLQDSSYVSTMKLDHLDSLITKLNSWLQVVDGKIDVELCQKAAHTLKLVARSMLLSTGPVLLSETIELTVKLLTERHLYDEAVTGSLLLLAAELMRFQRVKKAILYSNAVAGVCTEILFAVLEEQDKIGSGSRQTSPSKESASSGRRRRSQHSMSGRYAASGDALLICSLMCLQRILENFAEFVFKHLSSVLVIISRLCCVCDYIPTMDYSNRQSLPANKFSTAQQRIYHIWRALSKMELRIVLDAFDEACKTLMVEPAAVGILFKISSSINEMKNRSVLLKFVGRVCEFYFHGLDVRPKNVKLKEKDLIDKSEMMIIDSFLEVIDNLSENEFRTVTKCIQSRLEEALSPDAKMEKRYRLITIFRFLNRFYESYKNLSLPHFGRFFASLPEIFLRCNPHLTDAQSLLFPGEKDSVAARSMDYFLITAIDFVTNCAHHPAFFTLERAKTILDSLVNELENTDVRGHELRCVPHLAQCLYRAIDCQNEILMDAINKIMLKTRSRASKVRYRTLLLLEWLFEHMGDAVAPVLPSVLPFLSELLEDDNRKVEMQCDAVIGVLRKNFGEEITEGYV